MMLQKNAGFSLRSLKAMINIPIMAIVVGLTLGYFHFQPPQLLLTLTGNLANLASPLAMIYIGLLVPTLWTKRSTIPKLQLSVPIFLKLIILPVTTALIIRILALDTTIAQVALVQAAMPTITIASILFTKYQADVEMGAATTVFATTISLATIPVIIHLCSSLL